MLTQGSITLSMVRNDSVHVLDLFVASPSTKKKYQQNIVLMKLRFLCKCNGIHLSEILKPLRPIYLENKFGKYIIQFYSFGNKQRSIVSLVFNY